MRFDKDEKEFARYIHETSIVTGFNEYLIEKDFYVTLILKERKLERILVD